MFLFLDVASPIPEFHLIKDKNIIVSLKIVENNDEKPFFSLDNILEKHYYYGINKQALETDGNLMSGIKNKMKEINSSGQRGSYGVYETSYEQNYGYSIFFSQKIQKDTWLNLAYRYNRHINNEGGLYVKYN